MTAAPATGALHLTRLPVLTWLGAGIFLLLGVALFGPLLTSHDPHQLSIRMNEGPSADYWLGTDDVLSRLIAGTRLFLMFGAGLALVALALDGWAESSCSRSWT